MGDFWAEEPRLSLLINEYGNLIAGAATVRIAMPADMQGCLIFHYNLKFYDSEEDSFDAVSLKRFVMQVGVEDFNLRQVSLLTL